jgi:hypothetical protein
LPSIRSVKVSANAASASASPLRWNGGIAPMPDVYGFTLMSTTVLPGSEAAGKTHRSVKSRRASSPGNVRLAAL